MLHTLSPRQKIIIMIAVMSGLFLAALDQTIVGTALPKILADFKALEQLSWVVTAYLLTSTIAVPIAGKLSDLFGRRTLLIWGIVIFMIASLLCGAAQNIEQLIACRALQGLGGGILFANAFSVIGDLYNARERGKWQGIFGAVFGLSSLIGPLLGGYLTDGNTILGATTNWRWTFLINVPVGLISLSLIARFLPTIVAKKKVIIDFLGAGLLSGALASLVLACSLGGSAGWAWNSWNTMGLLAVATLCAGLFIIAERRAAEPIIPLRLFKLSIFSLVCVIMLLFGMAFFGAIIYIPTFAQQILHFSATNSGIILLPMVIGLTIGSVVVGQIVNKTGKYKLMVLAGLAVSAFGIWTLSGLTTTSDSWDLTWRMIVTGAGLGMAMPTFTVIAQNVVRTEDLGVASSSVQLFRSVGSTVGLAILGGVMNNFLNQKLANLQSEPFIKIAEQSGVSEHFQHIDINSLQGFFTAQPVILERLYMLPEPARQAAIDALHHFTATLQSAFASSITTIFGLAALVTVCAFILSLFLKEVPLKQHAVAQPDNP